MGKGSKRRPQVVNQKQFEDAWDNIFPKKKHKVEVDAMREML